MKKSRSLQRSREVMPHRLNWAFYMNGETMQMLDKHKVTPEELQMLQQSSLSQNPALFYGSGIKTGSWQTPQRVAKYERKLRKAIEDAAAFYGEMEEQFEQIDMGRFSRLSRTLTPGSPLLELEEEPGELDTPLPPPSPLPPLQEASPSLSPLPPPQETFLTDSQQS